MKSKCIHQDCITCAKYNILGQINALYCSKHKMANMININQQINHVNRRLCNFGKCSKVPQPQHMFCKVHSQ